MMKRLLLLLFVLLVLVISACSNAAGNSPGTEVPSTLQAPTANEPDADDAVNPAPTSTPEAPQPVEDPTPTPTAVDMDQGQNASPTPTETVEQVADDSPPTPTAQVRDQEQAPSPTPTEAPTQPPATSEAAEAVPTPEKTPPTPENCTDKAGFYGDMTVPDGTVFRQGDEFVKKWKFRNEGSCTWTMDYAAVFAYGDSLAENDVSPLPEAAAPGEIVEVSVPMVAPDEGGEHVSNWQFQNAEGERFGVGITGNDYFWVHILVSHIPPTPSSPGGPPEETQEPVADQQTSSPQGECAAERNPAFEAQVLTLINTARTNGGLGELSRHGLLNAAALAHSTDMACNDLVDHTGSDGSTWYDRISAQGYAYSAATENIYVGSPEFGGTPQGAFDWWWNSQIHHDNIMDPDRTEIGIGYVFNADSTYGGYYTLVFARR